MKNLFETEKQKSKLKENFELEKKKMESNVKQLENELTVKDKCGDSEINLVEVKCEL